MNGDHRPVVLIHGYRRSAHDWEAVMWGHPEAGIFGRITLGIKVAIEERAEHVYWGGGPEVKGVLAYVHDRLPLLTKIFGDDARHVLHQRSIAGTTGTTTVEEVRHAFHICRTNGSNVLALVSDEGHLERCYKFALRERRHLNLRREISILTKESDVSFSKQESILFEAPTSYRDNLHEVARRLLALDLSLNGGPSVAHVRSRLIGLIAKLEEEIETTHLERM